MRFHLGPPPTSDDFHPDTTGWKSIREPSALLLNVLGSVLAFPLVAMTIYCWSFIPLEPFLIHINQGTAGVSGAVLNLAIPVALLMAIVVPLILVHELIHALACPRLGSTRDTIIGLWPSRLLPYATYLPQLPCWRFLVVAAMPFCLLSILPLAAGLFWNEVPFLLAAISIINALLSGGDLLIILVIIWHIPLSATLRNQGWHTYWKP